jgi:hypothetical protein
MTNSGGVASRLIERLIFFMATPVAQMAFA